MCPAVSTFLTVCFALADGSPCQTAAWFEVMTFEGRLRKLALLPLLIDRLDASITPTAVCPADASEDLPQLRNALDSRCLLLFLSEASQRSSDLTVGGASCALWHQNLLLTQRPYKAAPVHFHNRSQPPRQKKSASAASAHQSKSADTSTKEPRHWSAIDLAGIRRINASERLAKSIDRQRGT